MQIFVKDNLSISDNGEIFHVSKGWFHSFKATTGVYGVTRHDESASADKKNCWKLPLRNNDTEKTTVMKVGFSGRKCPEGHTLSSNMYSPGKEENSGHEFMKDVLHLVQYPIVSGDLKIKHLLVYHSETP